MTTVAITAPTGCASINTAGLMDALRKTDRAWRMTRDPDAEEIFEVRLVGLDDQPIACRDGVMLHPHVAATQLDPPDLVVVPGLDDDLVPSFTRNRSWVPWIAKWHTAGARIATSCTGAFLAADAGVLDGKQATTHWIAADAFRRHFPRVRLTPERMIVDDGDVISSGGATTFLTLVIYLTERYGSHERAVLAAKVMLVDGERRSQLPYVAFGPSRDHADQLIHKVQSFMDEHLAADVSVEALAAYASVSTRTLNRRFKTATGQTPRSYLQRIRIQAAKRLLETTTDPIDHLRARVGYSDPTAFRRAFTQATGLGPRPYRQKYGPRQHTR
jgi:transcriptional regulator GlxA family with amidase domain